MFNPKKCKILVIRRAILWLDFIIGNCGFNFVSTKIRSYTTVKMK
jgi:hypothetical protein